MRWMLYFPRLSRLKSSRYSMIRRRRRPPGLSIFCGGEGENLDHRRQAVRDAIEDVPAHLIEGHGQDVEQVVHDSAGIVREERE
eukprot:4624410-Heterocapsa_arctica.AAC.1